MTDLIPIHEPAPPFRLPDLAGKTHSLEDHLGRVLVLNFWSAECPWSARADGLYASKLTRLAPATLLSIASNANETTDELVRAAEARQISTVLVDPGQAVADLYKAQTTPHYFVIDPDGVLRFQGAPDNASFRKREATEEYLIPAIEAVLGGRMPEPEWALPYGCTIVRNQVP